MPKGIYERTPHKMSESGIAALRLNAAKATAARLKKNLPDSPAAVAAKRKNAGKAVAVRTARAILKRLPVGAQVGVVFQATRYRKVTVIDPAPVQRTATDGNGQQRTVWEQRFTQNGKITIYGQTHEFYGVCRIVWRKKPTLENIMDAPIFEEIAGK